MPFYLDDHLLTLSQEGEVFAMGDDTYGQCANDAEQRPTFPPFGERRVSYPIKVVPLCPCSQTLGISKRLQPVADTA